ncbi:MAG TPA: GNAT family protein [Albitalea sp.]|nr:GNAT family protein [Albitalea sp.]
MASDIPLLHGLRGAGLCLRPFDLSDAEAFAAATRESVATVGRWMPWCCSDYSADDARAWFEECDQAWQQRSGFEFGVFADDGIELLGGAGLNQFNLDHNFCNLGYWVRESRQGRGIATRVVGLLADFGFRVLRLGRIEIVIAVDNAASSAVARKAGAQFEGIARNRLVIGGVALDAALHSLVAPPP